MSQIQTLEALVVKVEMIHEDIKDLHEIVKTLEEERNKRRGGLIVLSSVVGALGALVGWIATHLKN